MAPPRFLKSIDSTSDHSLVVAGVSSATETNADLKEIHDYLRQHNMQIPLSFLPDVSALAFLPQTTMPDAAPHKLLVAESTKVRVYAYMTMPIKKTGRASSSRNSKFWDYVVEKVEDGGQSPVVKTADAAAGTQTTPVQPPPFIKGPMLMAYAESLDGTKSARAHMNENGICKYDPVYPFNMITGGSRFKTVNHFNGLALLVKYFFLAKGLIEKAYDTGKGESFCRNLHVAFKRIENKHEEVLATEGEKGLARLKGEAISGSDWSDDEEDKDEASKEDVLVTSYRFALEPYREEDHPMPDAAEPIPSGSLSPPPAPAPDIVEMEADSVLGTPGPAAANTSRTPSSSPEPSVSEFPEELMPLPPRASTDLVSQQQQRFAFLAAEDDRNLVRLGEAAKDHIQVIKDIEDRKQKRDALKRKRDALDKALEEEELELEMLEMARVDRLKTMRFLMEESKGGKDN